jgi:ComF family protein
MKTSFWTKLFDLISPRLCAVCDKRLSANESVVCAACHLHLPITNHAASPSDNELARLFWGHFDIEKAAAYFYYTPNSPEARLIHGLKYHDRPETGEQMGIIAARVFDRKGFFSNIDGIIPMPITRQRRRQRGYNQSEEIARGISRVTGLPIYNKVVERLVFHESQTHLRHYERRDNVEHAFRLADGRCVANKHLLIVDDIITTGSTVTACACELLHVPGVRVSVFALGYTKW